MVPPVAIIFANIKGNIGDFAILDAMLRDLSRRFPGHPLHVFPHASLLVDAARFEAFRASGVPSFEIPDTSFSRSWPLHLKLAHDVGLWSLLRQREAAKIGRLAESAASVFRGYHAAFVAGGKQWGEYAGFTMFAAVRAIVRLGVPVYAYPFSVSPDMIGLNGEAALRRDFGMLGKPVVVRDTMSKAMLEGLGVDTVYGADCVYTLRDAAAGISPAAGVNSSRVILILTASRTRLRRHLDGIARRLKPHHHLSLMTTCEAEDGEIVRRAAIAHGLDYLAPMTWQEAVAGMKSSSLVISNRLHGLILGSFCDVPLLPVADRGKVAAFVRDSASPVHAKDQDAIGLQAVTEAITRGAEILQSLRQFQERNRLLPSAPFLPTGA